VRPMVTVQCWTGAQTKALRHAMRLSIRAFAAHLGVDARTVNKWEARLSTITLRPDTQALMDTALNRTPDDVKTRFTQTVDSAKREHRRNEVQPVEHAHDLRTEELAEWNCNSITFTVRQITGEDMPITRREALAAGVSAVLAGAVLTEPLQQWLLPIDHNAEFATRRPSDFSSTELASLEGLTEQFESWSNNGNGTFARKVVIAQLNDVTDRLHEVSPGPATWRAFGVAARLSNVVASMSWDAGLHRSGQRYY
jgi:transcriptional regulator with XRE-family HTH domain